MYIIAIWLCVMIFPKTAYSQNLTIQFEKYYTSSTNSRVIINRKDSLYHNYDSLVYFSTINTFVVPELFTDIVNYGQSLPLTLHKSTHNDFSIHVDYDGNGLYTQNEIFEIQEKKYSANINLIFPHSNDSSKNIIIPIRLKLSKSDNDYSLIGVVSEFLKTKTKLENQSAEHEIHIRKYLGHPTIKINNETVRYGDPYKIDGIYYSLKSIDYKTDLVVLEKQIDQNKPIGINTGYYIKMDSLYTILENRYRINLDRNVKTILHFWGSWCQPCMTQLEDISTLFDSLDTGKINIINIALLAAKTTEQIDKEIAINASIQSKYFDGIINLTEWPSPNLSPIIDLFKNSTYPNTLIIEPNGRIIFRDNTSIISLEKILSKI